MREKIDFQKFAEECLRLAANASAEDKAILLTMGQIWLKLAVHAAAIQALVDSRES